MRLRPPLIIIAALVLIPAANAQTAPPTATQPAASQQPATKRAATDPADAKPAVTQEAFAEPAAAPANEPVTAHAAHRARSSRSPKRRATNTAHASAPASRSGGVLSLGASDITGNKELPKVMVIVPWKDSLGAGGVVKPTDSLLDEVLQPVDRGVFQRRIRYYGQLDTGGGQAPAGDSANGARKSLAPVGDSH